MSARFNGADYDPGRDDVRLEAQLTRIWCHMVGGRWYTLREVAQAVDAPEASVSAQLRHLRKDRFGAHTVEKVHVGRGLYRYRLLPNLARDPRQIDLFAEP